MWARTLCAWRRPRPRAPRRRRRPAAPGRRSASTWRRSRTPPPPGRRTVTSGPPAALLGVDARSVRRSRSGASGPRPPARCAASARPSGPARRRRGAAPPTACAPRPGWPAEACSRAAIWAFRPPVSSARAFSTGGHLLLELGQGLGHRLQLRLQPRLGQLLAAVDRLLVLPQDRLGDAWRRLRRPGRSTSSALLAQHVDAPARPRRPRGRVRSAPRATAPSAARTAQDDRGEDQEHRSCSVP